MQYIEYKTIQYNTTHYNKKKNKTKQYNTKACSQWPQQFQNHQYIEAVTTLFKCLKII